MRRSSKTSFSLLAAVLAGAGLVAGSIVPASAGDWEDCNNPQNWDAMFNGCTRFIARGGNGPLSLSTAHNNRGHVSSLRGAFDAAIADFDRAIALNPTAHPFINKGLALKGKGNFPEAIAALSEGIALDPTSVISLINRARVYADAGDLALGLADADAALKFAPRSTIVHQTRASLLTRLERYGDAKQAIDVLLKVATTSEDKASAHVALAGLYLSQGQVDAAMQAYATAISITPNAGFLYNERGRANDDLRRYDLAITDFKRAIALSPGEAAAHFNLGRAYRRAGDFPSSLAALSKSIALAPLNPKPYVGRARTALDMAKFDEAEVDIKAALARDAKYTDALLVRALLRARTGRSDAALQDFTAVIEAKPTEIQAFLERGKVHLARAEAAAARADFEAALALPSATLDDKDMHAEAAELIAKLATPPPQPATSATASPPVTADPVDASPGRRIALVIGNADYGNYPRLRTPVADAGAIASALRRAGFDDVVEVTNLDYAAMRAQLKAFGDKATNADWAVLYFAGHGIQLDGQNYILPIDARLERVSHIRDEAVPLGDILDKLQDARKLKLVILDACRDNPFAQRLSTSTGGTLTRSIGRGLARVEPQSAGPSSGVLVAYSARDGQVADDGDGSNSPFAAALLQHIEEPGLDLGLLFRKVRDTVYAATQNRDRTDPRLQGPQEPFTYGSLPGQALYFRPPKK